MTAGSENKSVFFGFFLFAVSFGYGGLVKLRETLYKKGLLQAKTLLRPLQNSLSTSSIVSQSLVEDIKARQRRRVASYVMGV